VPTYLPDTNVLIDLGRDPAVWTKLENAERSGFNFVIAPSTITELTPGVVTGGATHFEQNKKIFTWLSDALGCHLGPSDSLHREDSGIPDEAEPCGNAPSSAARRNGGELSDVRRVSKA
jgi:hypothetical protein